VGLVRNRQGKAEVLSLPKKGGEEKEFHVARGGLSLFWRETSTLAEGKKKSREGCLLKMGWGGGTLLNRRG